MRRSQEEPTRLPTQLDWDQLYDDSVQGSGYAWLGIVITGGILGTFFDPGSGTLTGVSCGGFVGAVTCFFGFLLHVSMRGRLPICISSSFAGAAAGIACGAVVSDSFYNWPDGYCLVHAISAQAGSLGAQITTLRLQELKRKAPPSIESDCHQFSILDLMAFTTWLAVVLFSWQWTMRSADAETDNFLVNAVIISATMLVTEFLYRIVKDLRR